MSGFYGNGNGQIRFSRKQISDANTGKMIGITHDSGPINAMPFYQLTMRPEIWDDDFSQDQKFTIEPSKMQLKLENNGFFGRGQNWESDLTVNVKDVNTDRRGNSATIGILANCDAVPSARLPYSFFSPEMCFLGNHWDLDFTAETSKQCEGEMGPLSAGCRINLSATGEINHAPMPEKSLSSKATADKFVVTKSVEGEEDCKLRINYNDHQFYFVEKKQGRADWEHVVTVPGPAQFEQILSEFVVYFEPFVTYGHMASQNPDDAAHALVWIDRVWNTMTDQFDCSAIVEASMFEMPCLADKMGVPTVQQGLKEMCVMFNEMAVEGLKEVGNAYVKPARKYVNDLTSAKVGGFKFNRWYKALY